MGMMQRGFMTTTKIELNTTMMICWAGGYEVTTADQREAALVEGKSYGTAMTTMKILVEEDGTELIENMNHESRRRQESEESRWERRGYVGRRCRLRKCHNEEDKVIRSKQEDVSLGVEKTTVVLLMVYVDAKRNVEENDDMRV